MTKEHDKIIVQNIDKKLNEAAVSGDFDVEDISIYNLISKRLSAIRKSPKDEGHQSRIKGIEDILLRANLVGNIC